MPPDLALSALLIGLLAVVAVGALCMSWSEAPDPKLALLASLMQKSPKAIGGNTTAFHIQQTICRY
jgi:hypothetical protein